MEVRPQSPPQLDPSLHAALHGPALRVNSDANRRTRSRPTVARPFAQDYLFDLRGYLVLKQALSHEHVAELNAGIDDYVDLAPGEWRGWVQRAPPTRNTRELHNLFEAGPAFEALIDHPSWFSYMQRYLDDGLLNGGLFIDENFATITPGATVDNPSAGATGMHSGAHKKRVRTQFRYHDGEFSCGQLNILIALTDIGPGGARHTPGCRHTSWLPRCHSFTMLMSC
eukprot:COSAG06_NODE_924_length_11533_cov_65.691998_3_plen_226_part_00